MGKPATLLEGLCGHALSLGADSIEVEYQDGREWVYARQGAVGISIANYARSSADGKELLQNLYAAAKKPVRTVIDGRLFLLKVRMYDSFGEHAFDVRIKLAPKLDPSTAPRFTPKQGQYLAFHLQLHEDPPPGSCGVRSGTLFPGFPALGSRHGQGSRAQRPH